MGKNYSYKGYEAFNYLEPDIDYRSFKLAKQVGRVEEYLIPLTKTEEDRVLGLLEDSTVISMHEHLGVMPENIEKDFIDYQREGREFIGYEGLSISYLDAVFDDMMNGTAFITSKEGWKWDDIIYDLGIRLCDVAHQDFVIRCEKLEDIKYAHGSGRVALIPSVEGAAPIENEVERIEILYGLGIRKLGITYSESNALGTGAAANLRDGGLTDFGHDCIERMNKIGMAIDISHCSKFTMLDSIDSSKKPVMLSHTVAGSLQGSKQNRTSDEVFMSMAEKDGIAGVCAAPHSTWTVERPEHSIESYMEHMEYLINLVGVEHIGAGPDTLWGDHVELHHIWFNQKGRAITRRRKRMQVRRGERAYKPVEYVKGIENPSEGMINITRWLVKNGYSDEEIKKLIGENVIRFLERAW